MDSLRGAFFTLCSDLSFVVDLEGTILEVNSEWTQHLGWEVNELKLKKYTEFIHSEDQKFFEKLSQRRKEVQARVKHRDGHWILLNWRVEYRPQEKRVIGCAKNLFVEKQKQEQIDFILDAAGLGSFTWNIKTNEVHFTDTWFQMLGFKPGELKNHLETLEKMIHPEDRKQAFWILSEQLKGKKENIQSIFRMKHKKDIWISVLWKGKVILRDEMNQPLQYLGTHLDITNQVKAEIQVKESNQFLTAILDNLPQRVFWKDKQGNYLGCNPMFALDAGVSSSEISNKTDLQLNWTPETTRLYQAQDDQILFKNKEVLNHEEKQKRSDGSEIWIRMSRVPLRDENGQIYGILGIYDDISEFKELETVLETQRLTNINSAKMAALGEMAGGVAHEINNPLAIIQGHAYQLKRAADAGVLNLEKIKKVGDKVESMAKRIAKIIHSLRTYARDGHDDPFEKVSVKSIVSDTVELCKERLDHHHVEFKVEIEDENLSLECRMVQLVQILVNLINNSFDAISDLEKKWIRLEVKKGFEAVEFAVVDSGNGIPDELHTKILQPFFTTKEVGKGTGLGLSISSGIINAHHGEMYIDSSSENTRIAFFIPTEQPEPFEEEQEKAS